MARKIVKRWMPDIQRIRNHKNLRFLGKRLHDPNLWHLNRRSASGAFGIGLFWAFMPVPLQTIPAAISAIVLRVNLPISVALVWLTNPLTMAPVFYITYKLGSFLLGREPEHIDFAWSMEWVRQSIGKVWQPFLLGSVTLSTIAGLVGYFALRWFWTWYLMREVGRRKRRRPRHKR